MSCRDVGELCRGVRTLLPRQTLQWTVRLCKRCSLQKRRLQRAIISGHVLGQGIRPSLHVYTAQQAHDLQTAEHCPRRYTQAADICTGQLPPPPTLTTRSIVAARDNYSSSSSISIPHAPHGGGPARQRSLRSTREEIDRQVFLLDLGICTGPTGCEPRALLDHTHTHTSYLFEATMAKPKPSLFELHKDVLPPTRLPAGPPWIEPCGVTKGRP